jgi:hypothetical protein
VTTPWREHDTAATSSSGPCVLPYLPKVTKGALFVSKLANPADTTSKRLNRFLNDYGIVDLRKVVHSLRHRAPDRLRAAGCPEDVRWALLGHEEKTVAAGYDKASQCRCFASGWIRSAGCNHGLRRLWRFRISLLLRVRAPISRAPVVAAPCSGG